MDFFFCLISLTTHVISLNGGKDGHFFFGSSGVLYNLTHMHEREKERDTETLVDWLDDWWIGWSV